MELLEKLKDNNFKKEFEAKVKEKTNMPLAQAISITASEYGYETSPEELEKIFVVNQDLDENELEKIGGGPGIQKKFNTCTLQMRWLNRSSARISKTTKTVFSLVRSR